MPLIDVPYAMPLVYQLDSSLSPMQTQWAVSPLKAGWYLGDPAKVRAVQKEIQADLPAPAEGEDACLVPYGIEELEEEPAKEAEWKC